MNHETTNTDATVAEQGAHAAPKKVPASKVASRKESAPRGPKRGKAGKTKKKAETARKTAADLTLKKDFGVPHEASKKAAVLELVGRKSGATLVEIAKITKWQNHTIRGFLSATGKKQGIRIESTKNEAGDRIYRFGK
jgi:hypothetical protein